MSKSLREVGVLSGWNMWVFVGESVICFITGPDSLQGVHVQACSRRAECRAFLGTALWLQDHAKAPRGLAEVADADKSQKICGRQ